MAASVTTVQRLAYWAPRCVAAVTCLWIVQKSVRYVHKKVFRVVFPPIMQRFMVSYNKKMNDFKVELFRDLGDMKKQANLASMTVLEIGAGTGANFQYYPAGTTVIPVEPMGSFDSYLKTNAKKYPHLTVKDTVIAFGENMASIPDDSVHVVVVTLVLCSVRDVRAVLKEVKRVLKPNGRLFFMEHVYSDEKNGWLQTAQRFINPVWFAISGCSLCRATWRDIDSGGFSSVNYKKFNAPLKHGGKLVSPHVMGYAVK